MASGEDGRAGQPAPPKEPFGYEGRVPAKASDWASPRLSQIGNKGNSNKKDATAPLIALTV